MNTWFSKKYTRKIRILQNFTLFPSFWKGYSDLRSEKKIFPWILTIPITVDHSRNSILILFRLKKKGEKKIFPIFWYFSTYNPPYCFLELSKCNLDPGNRKSTPENGIVHGFGLQSLHFTYWVWSSNLNQKMCSFQR